MVRFRRVIPLLLATTAACAPQPRVEVPARPTLPSPFVTVKTTDGEIHRVPLEEYVHGAIVSEFAPSAADPSGAVGMYEVQAIVSRTYAVANLGRHATDGYDLCATTHCQVYQPARRRTSPWAGLATAAVEGTAGVLLWFDNAPALAVYHADCGGHTSAAASVWGGRTRPYLAAVPDDGPVSAAHRAWRYDVARRDLQRALDADPRTRVDDRLDAIEVLDRDAGGRAEYVALHGRRDAIVRGEQFRDVLVRAFGARSILLSARDAGCVKRAQWAVLVIRKSAFRAGIAAGGVVRRWHSPVWRAPRALPGAALRKSALHLTGTVHWLD